MIMPLIATNKQGFKGVRYLFFLVQSYSLAMNQMIFFIT